MRHISGLTKHLPVSADCGCGPSLPWECVNVPVVAGANVVVAVKEFFGYEQQETTVVGVTRLCK